MPSSRALRAKALLALQHLGFSLTPVSTSADPASTIGAAECQAMRQLLLLTQAEAGEWLSTPPVSERAWQYWEAGKRSVPADVAASLRAACDLRRESIEQAQRAIEAASGILHVGVWYAKAADWKWTLRPPGLPWKMHNSVVAHLAGQGAAKLVGFDEAAYAAWSEALPKINAARELARHGEWARSVLVGSTAGPVAPAGVTP